jgi:hypothetical protein
MIATASLKTFSTLAILFFVNNVFAAMPINQEIKCNISEMGFFINGNQTSKSNPSEQKPTYYRFDGKQIFAYYKGPNAPIVAANGAKFISRETVKSGGDRSFDVTKFEKIGSSTSRLDFFKEISGKSSPLLLIDRFSDNNFYSYGQYRSMCIID